jgi:hypothetical protein
MAAPRADRQLVYIESCSSFLPSSSSLLSLVSSIVAIYRAPFSEWHSVRTVTQLRLCRKGSFDGLGASLGLNRYSLISKVKKL